jgi:hypothetical protein
MHSGFLKQWHVAAGNKMGATGTDIAVADTADSLILYQQLSE